MTKNKANDDGLLTPLYQTKMMKLLFVVLVLVATCMAGKPTFDRCDQDIQDSESKYFVDFLGSCDSPSYEVGEVPLDSLTTRGAIPIDIRSTGVTVSDGSTTTQSFPTSWTSSIGAGFPFYGEMRTGFGISPKGFVTFNDNFNDENLDGCDQLIQNDARIFVYHNNDTAEYTYEFFDGDCPRTSDFEGNTNCLVIQWHDSSASVWTGSGTLRPLNPMKEFSESEKNRNVEEVETILYNRWAILFSNGEIRTEIESNNIILQYLDNRLGITSEDPSVGLSQCIPAGDQYLSSPCVESDSFWFCKDTPVLDVDEFLISISDTDALQYTDGNYRFGIDHLFVSDLDYTLTVASGNALVSMSADATNLDFFIDVSVAAAADNSAIDIVVINESFYTFPTTLTVQTILVDDSAETQNAQIVSSSIFGNVWILVISFDEPVQFDPTVDLLTVNGNLRSFKVLSSGSGSNKRDVESVEAQGSLFELVIEPICDGLVTATIPAGATVPFNAGVSAQIVASSCLLSAFARTLNV